MRLNLINSSVIVSSAMAAANIAHINPRFGEARALNDEVFKYAHLDQLNAVVVERVSLNDLFDGIPQDITGITFGESGYADLTELHQKLGTDGVLIEPSIDAVTYDESRPEDALGVFFVQWKRLIGLNGLERSEVDLSTFGDHMTINARNAVLYKGSVEVKIK